MSKPRVSDTELLAAYKRLGSVPKLMAALGYKSNKNLYERLERLGAPIGHGQYGWFATSGHPDRTVHRWRSCKHLNGAEVVVLTKKQAAKRRKCRYCFPTEEEVQTGGDSSDRTDRRRTGGDSRTRHSAAGVVSGDRHR